MTTANKQKLESRQLLNPPGNCFVVQKTGANMPSRQCHNANGNKRDPP